MTFLPWSYLNVFLKALDCIKSYFLVEFLAWLSTVVIFKHSRSILDWNWSPEDDRVGNNSDLETGISMLSTDLFFLYLLVNPYYTSWILSSWTCWSCSFRACSIDPLEVSCASAGSSVKNLSFSPDLFSTPRSLSEDCRLSRGKRRTQSLPGNLEVYQLVSEVCVCVCLMEHRGSSDRRVSYFGKASNKVSVPTTIAEVIKTHYRKEGKSSCDVYGNWRVSRWWGGCSRGYIRSGRRPLALTCQKCCGRLKMILKCLWF